MFTPLRKRGMFRTGEQVETIEAVTAREPRHAADSPREHLATVTSLSARSALAARGFSSASSSSDLPKVEAPHVASPVLPVTDAVAEVLSELLGPSGRYALVPKEDHDGDDEIFQRVVVEDALRRVRRVIDEAMTSEASR